MRVRFLKATNFRDEAGVRREYPKGMEAELTPAEVRALGQLVEVVKTPVEPVESDEPVEIGEFRHDKMIHKARHKE